MPQYSIGAMPMASEASPGKFRALAAKMGSFRTFAWAPGFRTDTGVSRICSQIREISHTTHPWDDTGTGEPPVLLRFGTGELMLRSSFSNNVHLAFAPGGGDL